MRSFNWIRRRLAATCATLVLGFTAAGHGQAASLSSSGHSLTGTVRIWGHGNRIHPYMADLVNAWEEAFRREHPQVHFENGMTGNASAIGGLFTGAADISFMDREIWATENDAFQQGAGHNPFSVAVASGSLDGANHAPALVVFVPKDNPITGVTLAQLDGIFGADHRRGTENLRTWGQLGLTGIWSNRPIHPYGYGILRRESQHWEQAVLVGSQKWNCAYREVGNRSRSADSGVAASRAIQRAVADDPDGIGFATLEDHDPRLKALGLAADSGGTPMPPTARTVAARTYPLVQTLFAYADRTPGRPLAPNVAAFLQFVLSPQGQQILERTQGYLPLPAGFIQQQLEKLQ